MVNPTSEFPKQLFWPDYKIQLQDWEMFPSSYHYYDFSTSPIWSLFTINSRPNHRSCPLQRLFENCLLFTIGGPHFTHFHFMSFKLYLAFRKVLSNNISPHNYSFLRVKCNFYSIHTLQLWCLLYADFWKNKQPCKEKAISSISI